MYASRSETVFCSAGILASSRGRIDSLGRVSVAASPFVARGRNQDSVGDADQRRGLAFGRSRISEPAGAGDVILQEAELGVTQESSLEDVGALDPMLLELPVRNRLAFGLDQETHEQGLFGSQLFVDPRGVHPQIPGVGLIVALTILAELGDWRRFRSRAAVSNYAGVVPRVRASNEKCWSGGITHQGPSHLRAMLVQAAWMAVEKVPVYRCLFDRVADKAGKQTAIVAVARELLEDAFTMLRKDEAFCYVAAPVLPTSAAPHAGQPVQERIRRSAGSSVAG